MRKLFKQGLALILTAAIAFTPTAPAFAAQVKPAAVAQETVQEEKATGYGAVKELADKKAKIITSMYGASSVQYALIDNGEIKLSGSSGYNNKEKKEKVTSATMYGMGSISKVYTAVAVMQLVDQEKIKLDEPVTTYIPEFKMSDERYKKITPRMLLNHSSGLMGSTFTGAALFEDGSSASMDGFLKQLEKQRLKADPGAYSVYCNDGFTLAEILVERVSGKTFSSYMASNITKPLKLQNTKTPQDKFNRDRLANTYYTGIKEPLPVNSFNVIGAGGIYSSAEDMCRFATIFMKDSPMLLSQKSVTDMAAKEFAKGFWPTEKDSVLNFGLGWDGVDTYPFNQYNIQALSKGGDTYLYHGNMTVLPEYNMAVVVLSSGGSSALGQIMAQEILLSALKEKELIKEILPDKTFTKPVATEVPEEYKVYDGIYLSSMGGIKVKMDKDKFIMSPVGGGSTFEIPYTYVGNDKFVSADGSTIVRFVREKNNKVYFQVDQYTSVPGLGQTVASVYNYEKAEPSTASKEAIAAWKEKENKLYFVVGEPYNSQLYMLGIPATKLMLLDGIDYVNNAAIVDEILAQSNQEIPGTGSRDFSDYQIYTDSGIEYMAIGGMISISEDTLPNLPKQNKFIVKIGAKGYASVYKVPKSAAGKVLDVKVPENASYAVYDKDGLLVNYSLISKTNKTKLPEGGFVYFMGSPNEKFSVNYQAPASKK